MSRLGDTIRNERLRLGLNPKALAKKCGVSEKFLLEVESGSNDPASYMLTVPFYHATSPGPFQVGLWI